MELLLRFPGGLDKAVTFSYDDGITSDIPLAEIFNKHGMRATFNINTGMFAEEGTPLPADLRVDRRRLTKREALDLFGKGPHEVAVHGVHHTYLSLQTPLAVTEEVLFDRREIEAMFGTVCRGMAYPFGSYNENVINCLRACDIAYSRTTYSSGSFGLPSDWLRLGATCHHNDPHLFDLADRFLQKEVFRPSKLFYLWGHSYEFCEAGNWSRIEDFCAKVDREDVFRATNIELHDYIEAFRALQISSDERRVHNPTATDVWLCVRLRDEQAIRIPAGETVEL